jgi:hypothetical protein
MHFDKSDRKLRPGRNEMCKGIHRRKKTQIPCRKKANFVCRLSKEEIESGKSGASEGTAVDNEAGLNNTLTSETTANAGEGNFDLSSFFEM